MAGEILTFDPTAEATGTELVLSSTNSYYLMAHSYPTPDRDVLWVGSADTDGDQVGNVRYRNREITFKLRVRSRAALANLELKIGKLNREGGTLKRTLPDGTAIVFDVVDAQADGDFTNAWVHSNRVEVDVKLTCRPFGRGPAVQLSDHAETSLPYLSFVETGIDGDVPALGKLVIDEDQGADQGFVMWGVQSRYYDSAATADVFYTAPSRTPLTSAATAAGSATPYGAGSNVIRHTDLSPAWQAVLSTQAVSGSAHLSHIGTFRVWARVYRPTGNTGAVSVRLRWAQGDFLRSTTNAQVDFAADSREGVWNLVDLGLVQLDKVPQGTQRWEGRIEAKSTVAGDEIDVNFLMIIPVDEGYGEARSSVVSVGSTSLVARDEFDQSAAALATKTLPLGGTWSGAGDADDFAVEATGHTAQRVAVSDTVNTGRFAIAGTTNYAALTTSVDIKASVAPLTTDRFGLIARYVDTSNYVVAYITAIVSALYGTTDYYATVYKRVAGTLTRLAPDGYLTSSWLTGSYYQIQLGILASGVWAVYAQPQGLPASVKAAGSDADLATGGTLASGKAGMYDEHSSAAAVTRNYDNFWVASQVGDAAMYGSQSLELRNDRVIREDSGGTIWTPPSKYYGDYLQIPPASLEARSARLVVKASRNDPDVGSDSGIDDLSARLTVTPRYLVIPEPA